MKKLVLTLTLAIAALLSFAQIPQTFSYQGVVRDADSKIVAEKPITVNVQILQGADDGTAVYTETHQVTTNANGLMTFELGSKDAEKFAKIDWSNAPYFVKTVAEFDGKQISGVTPLLAVPYALYAEKAGNADVDLSAYATKEELPSVEGLASESYVNEKVAEIDLSNYYLKSDVDALFAKLNAKIKQLDKQLYGVIEFAFSVSADKKIYFSQGNLQYQASTGTWRFAENQWDFVGGKTYGTVYENGEQCDNINISATYEGWIDLFGWGTSGYKDIFPYTISTTNTDYGDGTNDIAGTSYDWGMYNAISNGGNKAGMWRTLTHSEWHYLRYERIDADVLYGVATVNGVNGCVILPDNWTIPFGVTFISGANGDFSQNIYTTSDWSKMESNGAVFLPAAGNRYSTDVRGVGSFGNYWTISFDELNGADVLNFGSGNVETIKYDRYHGRSVRLVRDAE